MGTGCKSKKKAMEAANKKADREYVAQQAALEKKKKEEEQARLEAEERARRDAAAATNVEPKQKLGGYFNSIASSGNATSANTSINEALTMFASPQTPVLIVISEYNGQKDYDRPTTIVDYLNYLKDQKKNMNTISNIQYDAAGKITELELSKTK
jgi:hypothetical protein